MIATWNYTNFLYRPRRPEELDTAQGGGIVFNQMSHQIDTVRLIGGGRLRSVVDVLIAVPSDETPRIQECHILVGHALCDAVEQAITAEPVAKGAAAALKK